MSRRIANDSRTGRSHHSCVRCPNTAPTLRALRSRLRYGTTPATRASPDVGVRMPVSILMVVDLPAPFGPSRASSSPGDTSKVMSVTACCYPFGIDQ
ncbi:hypothetical protein SVIOM74S_03710 [Streptomyces violarus]